MKDLNLDPKNTLLAQGNGDEKDIVMSSIHEA